MAPFLCNWIFPKSKTIPFEDMYKEFVGTLYNNIAFELVLLR